MDNVQAVVELASMSKGVVVDDHNNGTMKLAGVGVLTKGDKRIPVALCNAAYFSLNDLYIGDDGKVHLSRWSVAGVVNLMGGRSLSRGIEMYNEDQKNYIFSNGSIEDVVYFM